MKSSCVATSKVSIGALALLACLSAGTVSTAASSGHFASLDERIQGSQKVVIASARSVNASWRENTYGDRLIVSRILLDVEETLKGPATSNAIWMDLEGGTLDGFTLVVSDLPTVRPGERAVFFLDQDDSGITTPHLRGQGILKLDENNVVRGSSLRVGDIRIAAQARH
jgi:hypothetical protein